MVEKANDFKKRFDNVTQFSFTIVPDESVISSCSNSPKRVSHYITRYVSDSFFLKTKYMSKIELYFDISFPDYIQVNKGKTGSRHPRIHYHGYFEVRNVDLVPLVMLKMRKLASAGLRLEVDTITDLEDWLPYCQKYTDVYPTFKQFNIKIGRELIYDTDDSDYESE